MTRPIRLMLVVSSLERGGAERQVVHLANHLPALGFDVSVCALSGNVPLARELDDAGRRLVIVPKRWRFDAGVVTRLARRMRALQIDVAHAFLFDAEIATRLAARLAGAPVVVASERNADYRRPRMQALGQRLTRGLCDGLIANSAAGKRFAMRTLGLPAERVHVVRNGVDTGRFRPVAAETSGQRARCALRRAWGLAGDAPLVGMAANLKPQKNHHMFLRVAQRVLARVPQARFVCVGDRLEQREGAGRLVRCGAGRHGDTSAYRRSVLEALHRLGLADRVLYPGRCDDPPAFYRACDVTALTSRHEGTPNVLLESLAAGVPVVATDVADNAAIVGDGECGWLVALDDDAAAADRIVGLLLDHDRRAAMGRAARRRACSAYSLERLARNAAQVYRTLLARKTAGGRTGLPADSREASRPEAELGGT